MLFGDIVEENGKTIRENNLEKQHNIPLGALVEVKYNKWHGGGACSKIHARLWVVKCSRDCDGTPLYWLSKKAPTQDKMPVHIYYPEESWGQDDQKGLCLNENISRSVIEDWVGGFSEESLTVIEITDRLKDGYDSLSWD